jgi:hypothetical protein
MKINITKNGEGKVILVIFVTNGVDRKFKLGLPFFHDIMV